MNRGLAAFLVMGSLAAACHQPTQPPAQPPVPPQPTNPTAGRAAAATSASSSGQTVAEIETDASIVREAGPIPPADAGVGMIDAAPVGPR